MEAYPMANLRANLRAKVFVTVLAALGFVAAGMMDDANARQSGGGGGGGRGGASFSASAGGGGARFAASAAGFGVSARAVSSASRVAFSAGSARASQFVATRPTVVHRRHRGHGAYFVGYAPITYGFVTQRYDHCRWLRVRYEDTGLRKWRLRYEACRDGDDD
jgi:hypothetical protein